MIALNIFLTSYYLLIDGDSTTLINAVIGVSVLLGLLGLIFLFYKFKERFVFVFLHSIHINPASKNTETIFCFSLTGYYAFIDVSTHLCQRETIQNSLMS